MKLSFSTRGWPELSWQEMIDTALDMRFAGIEVYNLQKLDALTDRGSPFHKYQTAATVRQLRENKLSIPCFDTSCDLSEGESCVETLLELMEVARNMQVAYVVACALQENEEQVQQNLSRLVTAFEKAGVTLLLKTSDAEYTEAPASLTMA